MRTYDKGDNPTLWLKTAGTAPDTLNLVIREPDATETAYSCTYNSSTARWETSDHTFDQSGIHHYTWTSYISGAIKSAKYETGKVNDNPTTYPYPTPP